MKSPGTLPSPRPKKLCAPLLILIVSFVAKFWWRQPTAVFIIPLETLMGKSVGAETSQGCFQIHSELNIHSSACSYRQWAKTARTKDENQIKSQRLPTLIFTASVSYSQPHCRHSLPLCLLRGQNVSNERRRRLEWWQLKRHRGLADQ